MYRYKQLKLRKMVEDQLASWSPKGCELVSEMATKVVEDVESKWELYVSLASRLRRKQTFRKLLIVSQPFIFGLLAPKPEKNEKLS